MIHAARGLLHVVAVILLGAAVSAVGESSIKYRPKSRCIVYCRNGDRVCVCVCVCQGRVSLGRDKYDTPRVPVRT